MKIYTRTGDTGTTSLANGQRVNKNNLRIETYGTADELNVNVGLLRFHISDNTAINEQLTQLQNKLFNLGALLSLAPGTWITEKDSLTLEQWIDDMQEQLPELHSFILPYGTEPALLAHLCRTKTRQLERLTLTLYPNPENDNNTQIIYLLRFLNRLSDYFFILAKYINLLQNTPETNWNKN